MSTTGRQITKRLAKFTWVCLGIAVFFAIVVYYCGARVPADKQSFYYEKMEAVSGKAIGWLFSSSGITVATPPLLNVLLGKIIAKRQLNKIKNTVHIISLFAILFFTVTGGAWCAAFVGEINPPPSVVISEEPKQVNGAADTDVPSPTVPIDPHPWDFVKLDENLDDQANGVINWLNRNRFSETPAGELSEYDYKQRVAAAAKKEANAKIDHPVTIKRYLDPEEMAPQKSYMEALTLADGPIALRIEADKFGKTFANRKQIIIYYENVGDICLRLSEYEQAFRFFQDAYYWCIEALLVADTETEVNDVKESLRRLYGISNDRFGDAGLIQALPGRISSNQLSQSIELWNIIFERQNDFLQSSD